MLTSALLYALVGAVAGILAGLFGIGGGLVIVPMLVYVFAENGIPYELRMHLALATSMATIIFTSVSSLLAHHRRGAVRWQVVRKILFGIFCGTFLGACSTGFLSTTFLKIFFVIFLFFVATQILLDKKPAATRGLPEAPQMFAAGGIIGFFSSLAGIGGGTLSVPFMLWCNISAHQAVGTAAAIGFPLAVAGTAGYIVSGWGHDLPAYSLGFVYLPALLGITLLSVATAPLGVRLAHSLPVARLKRYFALLLYLVAVKMLMRIF